MLALATLANVLSYSDTILLSDKPIVEALGVGMPVLIDALRQAQQRPQRFYAAAAVANASCHPNLAGILNQNGGEERLRQEGASVMSAMCQEWATTGLLILFRAFYQIYC